MCLAPTILLNTVGVLLTDLNWTSLLIFRGRGINQGIRGNFNKVNSLTNVFSADFSPERRRSSAYKSELDKPSDLPGSRYKPRDSRLACLKILNFEIFSTDYSPERRRSSAYKSELDKSSDLLNSKYKPRDSR